MKHQNFDNISSSDKIKLYLTGYGPFGDIKENPSQLLVDYLEDLNKKGEFPTFGDKIELIFTHILDVNVESVQNHLKEINDIVSSEPDNSHLIIHFGVDAGIDCIDLENVARNYICDYKGLNGKIIESDKEEDQLIFSKFDLESIRKILSDDKIKVSQNAGTYLCNYVYYLDSYELSRPNENVHCLFIHVPELHHLNTKNVSEKVFKILNQLCLDIDCFRNQEYFNINEWEFIDINDYSDYIDFIQN